MIEMNLRDSKGNQNSVTYKDLTSKFTQYVKHVYRYIEAEDKFSFISFSTDLQTNSIWIKSLRGIWIMKPKAKIFTREKYQ